MARPDVQSRGFGRELLDRLADEWGWDQSGRTTIWFEVECASQMQRPASQPHQRSFLEPPHRERASRVWGPTGPPFMRGPRPRWQGDDVHALVMPLHVLIGFGIAFTIMAAVRIRLEESKAYYG